MPPRRWGFRMSDRKGKVTLRSLQCSAYALPRLADSQPGEGIQRLFPVVLAATGGSISELTAPTFPSGHQAIFEMAVSHGGSRAWTIEGPKATALDSLTCFASAMSG